MIAPRIVVVALAVLLTVTACGVKEAHEPTVVAQVHIPPRSYSVLLSRLDAEMAKFGLIRGDENDALRKLFKEQHARDVLFFAYRFKEDKLRFLVASDTKKVGVVEISLFPEALPDEKTRREAISRIETLVAEFGAKLEPFKRWNSSFNHDGRG